MPVSLLLTFTCSQIFETSSHEKEARQRIDTAMTQITWRHVEPKLATNQLVPIHVLQRDVNAFNIDVCE